MHTCVCGVEGVPGTRTGTGTPRELPLLWTAETPPLLSLFLRQSLPLQEASKPRTEVPGSVFPGPPAPSCTPPGI